MKKYLVVEKPGRNQEQGTRRRDKVIRVVLRVIDVGVVLQVNPRKYRKGKTQHQGTAMTENGINYFIPVGRIVGSIVDHGTSNVEG